MADKYQIPFINACIRAFAKRVGLPVKNVFQYLDRFKGVDFLIEFYPTQIGRASCRERVWMISS